MQTGINTTLSKPWIYPANINLFKINKRNTIKRLDVVRWRQWRRSGVFIVNFKHISHFGSSVSIVEFEEVNVSWVHAKDLKIQIWISRSTDETMAWYRESNLASNRNTIKNVLIVNFDDISYFFLVFLLLHLKRFAG